MKQNKTLIVKEVVIKMPDTKKEPLRNPIAWTLSWAKRAGCQMFFFFTEVFECLYCLISVAGVSFAWPLLHRCSARLRQKMLSLRPRPHWARIRDRAFTPASE